MADSARNFLVRLIKNDKLRFILAVRSKSYEDCLKHFISCGFDIRPNVDERARVGL